MKPRSAAAEEFARYIRSAARRSLRQVVSVTQEESDRMLEDLLREQTEPDDDEGLTPVSK